MPRFKSGEFAISHSSPGPVEKCSRDSGIGQRNAQGVALVGGATRSPKAQALIQDIFRGREPCYSANLAKAATLVQLCRLHPDG